MVLGYGCWFLGRLLLDGLRWWALAVVGFWIWRLGGR